MTDYDVKQLKSVYYQGKEAAFKLALVHMHGLGCSPAFKRDYTKIEPLLKEAVKHKVPGARSELANFLYENNNLRAAVPIWMDAAADNEPLSQLMLGKHLSRRKKSKGRSGAYLLKKAGFKGLRQLAEAGDPIAQYHLGVEMAIGEVEHRSLEYADWYEKAIVQGHLSAEKRYEMAKLVWAVRELDANR